MGDTTGNWKEWEPRHPVSKEVLLAVLAKAIAKDRFLEVLGLLGPRLPGLLEQLGAGHATLVINGPLASPTCLGASTDHACALSPEWRLIVAEMKRITKQLADSNH